MKTEWRVKYLVEPIHPFADEMRQRDEAVGQAEALARRDAPEAAVIVLSINRTPRGRYSVEVLRTR